ncbi:hypothetical protein DYB35_011436 [Aphanomyces astaci]|uniref:subtilisin n=1 Tax=Aphanomyces astaci TaxID=112090 RepID=A0A3R6WP37_APHAT|nr:hypothetical protein DYB35_011436 [Aphanomyces astaci]
MVQYRFMALAALAVTAVTGKISVQVHRNLEVANQSNVVVQFYSDEALATHRRRLKGGASRTEIIKSLVDSLKEHTTTSQASVKSLLANQVESTAVEVGTTWIDSSIDDEPANAVVNEAIGWGVKKIQAPALWAENIKGDGIVVANIDTGVRHTHESLKSNWRSEYGWFDPYNKTELPNNAEGHGTHVMGTMVGTNGIGVAPHAKWIACKGCGGRLCNPRKVVECGQFLLCPHDKDGNNCDSSKAPHVINISIGKHTKKFWLEDTITKWREVGIIPVFPNGNDGLKGCAYSDYPAGSPQVIAVGNTDSRDFLAFDSSLGPFGKRGKPDISAPGVRIRSAVHSSNDGFSWRSGTSMSTPHVSGAIALYLSANKGASYDQVYKALTENVDTDTLSPPDKTCGGIPNTQYPNNLFGYGRLNIFKAVAASIPGLTLPPPSKSTQVLNPTVDLSTCGTLEVNTNYIGGDLTSVNLATAESCCAECKKTKGCKAFVWYTLNGGLCRLKDTQGPKVYVDGARAGVLPAPALARRPFFRASPPV